MLSLWSSKIVICLENEKGIKIFEQKQLRIHWDEEQEKWYFSIVDVIKILTDSDNPQVYWRVLKKRLLAKGNETVTNCKGLKMQAPDGKMRMTDVADTLQAMPEKHWKLKQAKKW